MENSSSAVFGAARLLDGMESLADGRVETWLGLGSPWPTLALCTAYYYVVRFAGPAYMKDKVS